jgi:Kef-type K+ transport system membrane component KefB/nucleotide-binding universal stress UspA family protein
MFLASIAPLPGHAVFLLLIQLALLLFVARVGASLARLAGLPAVVGELAAGIVLGPTVFGHYAPGLFQVVFPQTTEQFHLLETVGMLGMAFLLLLTGLETDLKLLRNLGRAAVVASVLGLILPFALGFGLGLWMPESYLAQPDRRVLFASFLATSMAISAMPVIAKILMDLDLTRRNIGLVILSAGVVDDTAGWLILSVIAGAATQGGAVQLGSLGLTIVYLFAYLLVTFLIAYPLLRVGFQWLARRGAGDTDLVLLVVFALVSAAFTEKIGVHAVFGAFIAGTALRQVPHLKAETVHRLEGFVFPILAPVFFGIVGLKVDLWALSGGGGSMLAIVLGIACVGKLVGCVLGGIWGGLSFWESMSIAVAMNARGAMGLVVASMGLGLGILNSQMFSIIVVVAIATSFLAPVLLRLTMRMVRMTRDEEERILAAESRGVFDRTKLRILVPTAGGPNALAATAIALDLASHSSEPVEVVYVDARANLLQRLLHPFEKTEAGKNLEDHFDALRKLAGTRALRIRRASGSAAAQALVDEAGKGFDLVLIGASGGSAKLGGPLLEEIVENAPCHVAIVKAAKMERSTKRVFVPIDGSSVSRMAAELGLHYAEATDAKLTLGMLSERRTTGGSHLTQPDTFRDVTPPPPSVVDQSLSELVGPTAPAPAAPDELLRVSPVFRVAKTQPELVRIAYDPGFGTVAESILRGGHGLVVLGAENRAVRRRLFFGHENEKIINLDSVTTVILVPRR